MEMNFSTSERTRYARHFALPGFGFEGQARLKKARVLLVGVGGLGSATSMHLAAAGVGHIGLVDDDRVELSNLQRQIVHGTGSLGEKKVKSAQKRLADINPEIEIETFEMRLDHSNAADLFEGYDLIVDGTDNFQTRYLINDACVAASTPYVYSSIYQFEGRLAVFATPKGPCYRCIYPEPPPEGLTATCTDAGVLGVLPGIAGTMQAAEAIKYLAGVGDVLSNQLLVFNVLTSDFQKLMIPRDRNCPACGDLAAAPPVDKGTVDKGAVDKGAVDKGAAAPEPSADVPDTSSTGEIEPRQLQAMLATQNVVLIDIREIYERKISSLDGYLAIPIEALLQAKRDDALDSLPFSKEDRIVIYCRNGMRSRMACRILRDSGYEFAANLKGGILAWADEVDPDLAKY